MNHVYKAKRMISLSREVAVLSALGYVRDPGCQLLMLGSYESSPSRLDSVSNSFKEPGYLGRFCITAVHRESRCRHQAGKEKCY